MSAWSGKSRGGADAVESVPVLRDGIFKGTTRHRRLLLNEAIVGLSLLKDSMT